MRLSAQILVVKFGGQELLSSLKRWALGVAQRRGMKRAKVALARKLGVVLHRMWVDATEFRWSNAAPAA